MRSVPWITFYVGLAIGGGYVLGAGLRWHHSSADRPRSANRVQLVEGVSAVGWSILVLWIIDRVAPGNTTFRDFSAVGFLSSQSLTAWESASLWSGLAVVVGLTFPAPLRVDRGSSGVAAVAVMLVWHLPIALFVAGSAFFGAQLAKGNQRWSWTIAIIMLPVSEWVASIVGVRAAWGLIHGPETALWMLAVAGVLAARRGRTQGGPFDPA